MGEGTQSQSKRLPYKESRNTLCTFGHHPDEEVNRGLNLNSLAKGHRLGHHPHNRAQKEDHQPHLPEEQWIIGGLHLSVYAFSNVFQNLHEKFCTVSP